MRLKILLTILGLLVIGSGSYVAANTVFKPKPPKPTEFIGFDKLKKEATDSAKSKDSEPKNEVANGEVQGTTTQTTTPTTYKPTPQAEAATKELTQTIESINKVETPPALPEIPTTPPPTSPTISEEHLNDFWNLYNQIKSVGDQMIAIKSQIDSLQVAYYQVPSKYESQPLPLNVIQGKIQAEQAKISNQINLLVAQYNQLYSQQVQLFSQYCSTYYDVVIYYNFPTSSCS